MCRCCSDVPGSPESPIGRPAPAAEKAAGAFGFGRVWLCGRPGMTGTVYMGHLVPIEYHIWGSLSKTKKFCEKFKKMLANPAFLRYDNQARVRKTGIFCPFAGAYDCTICDDAGGCGWQTAGFSAEYVRFQTGRKNTVCSGRQRGGSACPTGGKRRFLRLMPVSGCRTLCRPGVRRLRTAGFFMGRVETPGSVSRF